MQIIDFSQYIIIAICLTVGKWLKARTRFDNQLIPVACGVIAWALAAAGHKYLPGFPTETASDAIELGILGGLSAIGVHQLGKASLPAIFGAFTEQNTKGAREE
ncbi:MAG: phage holin family protein [Oscillospiraceae bacterium]|nr:phage holin family protein [Oscillospiraceae bacterium]